MKKKNFRDFYREIGDDNSQIIRKYIPMAGKTLEKLRQIAHLRNISVNYLIVMLIERGLRALNKGFKGCKLLSSKRELKNSREF